ncbi:hypothetical protein NO2_1709, partial [Candidatus Termititenax persephonae]
YSPPASACLLPLTAGAGRLNLDWDGSLPDGGCADNGEYYFQLSCYQIDGGGFKRAQVTFNIATAFEASSAGLSPADGVFDVLGGVAEVSCAYLVNKDSYLSAFILDERGTVVSSLPEQKVLGSAQVKHLAWGGAYPAFASRQRLVSGNYQAILVLRACDGTGQESLTYAGIRIRGALTSGLAQLEPVGEPLLFNGQTVRAATGTSQYYWSAHGEGRYTVPQAFNYELGLTGGQVVTAAPFVPFAGLYHRGFDRVNLQVEVTFRWSASKSSPALHLERTDSRSWHVYFTPGRRSASVSSEQIAWNWGKGGGDASTDYIWIVVKDMAGNVLDKKETARHYYNGLLLNGALSVSVS